MTINEWYPVYRLVIGSVDGITSYIMIASHKDLKYLLEFLKRYDHEGSCVSLDKFTIAEKPHEEIESGKIYKELGDKDA